MVFTVCLDPSGPSFGVDAACATSGVAINQVNFLSKRRIYKPRKIFNQPLFRPRTNNDLKDRRNGKMSLFVCHEILRQDNFQRIVINRLDFQWIRETKSQIKFVSKVENLKTKFRTLFLDPKVEIFWIKKSKCCIPFHCKRFGRKSYNLRIWTQTAIINNFPVLRNVQQLMFYAESVLRTFLKFFSCSCSLLVRWCGMDGQQRVESTVSLNERIGANVAKILRLGWNWAVYRPWWFYTSLRISLISLRDLYDGFRKRFISFIWSV